MKKWSVKQYATALYDVTKDLPTSKIDAAVQAFLTLLKKKQFLSKISSIINEFETYAQKQNGVKDVTITSAHLLEKKILNQISSQFADKTEVTTALDPILIAGFIVRTEDTILDASVRKQLKVMKQHLIY
jgi:F-type H+-transporting ATPase subunit delta